jgi:hypothetical protein
MSRCQGPATCARRPRRGRGARVGRYVGRGGGRGWVGEAIECVNWRVARGCGAFDVAAGLYVCQGWANVGPTCMRGFRTEDALSWRDAQGRCQVWVDVCSDLWYDLWAFRR